MCSAQVAPSMAWIESHQSLKDHPKLHHLSQLLHVGRPAAIGHLHMLWWWALDYAPDGDITDIFPGTIAASCDWVGRSKTGQQFVTALVDSGWLDVVTTSAERRHDVAVTSGGRRVDVRATSDERRDDVALRQENVRLVLHEWQEYAGRLLQRRRLDRERKASVRRNSTEAPPDVLPPVRRNSASTVPNPTEHNSTNSTEPYQESADTSPFLRSAIHNIFVEIEGYIYDPKESAAFDRWMVEHNVDPKLAETKAWAMVAGLVRKGDGWDYHSTKGKRQYKNLYAVLRTWINMAPKVERGGANNGKSGGDLVEDKYTAEARRLGQLPPI